VPTLHSPCPKLVPWEGPQLVKALQSWLKYGHVVEEEGAVAMLNETAELEKMEVTFTQWLKKQCKSLNRELKGKLRHLSRNNTRHLNERAAMLKETVAKLDTFHKASMSKAVQQSAFWRMPGKVANLVELQAKSTVKYCSTKLVDTHAEQEARLVEWWSWMAEQAALRVERKRQQEEEARRTSPPPPSPRRTAPDLDEEDGAVAAAAVKANRTKSKRPKQRSARHGRKNATAARAKAGTLKEVQRQGREECFTVYDD